MVVLRRLTAGLLLAGAFAAPALADFKRDYQSGLDALRAQDYSAAVRELEKAAAANPQSVERMRIYGMRFEPYLPHYYLGEARFGAGDCVGALAAWAEAERQRVITTQPQYQSLKDNQARCAASQVDIGAIAATARSAIGDLATSLGRLSGLKDNRLLAEDWNASPEWQSALDQGTTARSGLETELRQAVAASDVAAIERITEAAGQSRRDLDSAFEAAGARLETLERQQRERVARERNEARVELIQAIAAARSALGEPVVDEQAKALAGELRTLAERGDALDAGAAVSQYRSLSRSLNGKLREYRQAVQDYRNRQLDIARRTPPPELLEAARAYFDGRYQETARLLADPGRFSDPRAQVQAHLFRAAAHYNLYVLAGENDQTLLARAQDDVRSVKRLNGGYSPYLAAFPPKFMSFYEATL